MPRIAALYRYPVKGFTPEACDTLTVLDAGRIACDRVLGIRFADSAAADEAWSKKTEVITPPRQRGGFVRNACVYNHYVSPNRLDPSPELSATRHLLVGLRALQARLFLSSSVQLLRAALRCTTRRSRSVKEPHQRL
jgi:hypothetical protein